MSTESLNELATTDLDDPRIPPEANDVTDAPSAVVVAGGTPSIENEEAVAAAIQQLEGYNTAVATADEGVMKVRDMNEVISTILAAETISRSDARNLRDIFGEKFDHRFSVEEYTELPSGVNLRQTKRFLEKRMEETEEIEKTKLKAFEELSPLLPEIFKQVEYLLDKAKGCTEGLEEEACEELEEMNEREHRFVYNLVKKDGSVFDISFCSFASGLDSEDLQYQPRVFPNQEIRNSIYKLPQTHRAFVALCWKAQHASCHETVMRFLENPNLSDEAVDGSIFNNYRETLAFLASGTLSNTLVAIFPQWVEKISRKIEELEASRGHPQDGEGLALRMGEEFQVVNSLLNSITILVQVIQVATLMECLIEDMKKYREIMK